MALVTLTFEDESEELDGPVKVTLRSTPAVQIEGGVPAVGELTNAQLQALQAVGHVADLGRVLKAVHHAG